MSYKSLVGAIKNEQDIRLLYALRNVGFQTVEKHLSLEIIEYVAPHIDNFKKKKEYYTLAGVLATIKLNGSFTENYNFGEALSSYDKKNETEHGRLYLNLINNISARLFLTQLVNWVNNINKSGIAINGFDLAEAVTGDEKVWKNKKQQWAENYFRRIK